jgi:hypothetical protein
MNARKILTGQKFGLLTVGKQVGTNKWKNSIWLCKCECGGEKEVLYQRLTQKQTRSCGCLRKKKTT